MKAAQQKSSERFAIWSFTSNLCWSWCPFCIVLLSFLTDLYSTCACAWAFGKPGSENAKNSTVPKRTVKREPWLPLAAARWTARCTGINVASVKSIFRVFPFDSLPLDPSLICWNDCCPFNSVEVSIWNLEFLTWVKYGQACFTRPLICRPTCQCLLCQPPDQGCQTKVMCLGGVESYFLVLALVYGCFISIYVHDRTWPYCQYT